MRSLVVEDEFISRRVLQRLLSELGKCDVAVDGEEAKEAFSLALSEGEPYALICLDIMLPSVSGQQVLEYFRQVEQERDIPSSKRCHVVMTTSLGESKEVLGAFRRGAEAYLVKPIERVKLFSQLEKLGLVRSA